MCSSETQSTSFLASSHSPSVNRFFFPLKVNQFCPDLHRSFQKHQDEVWLSVKDEDGVVPITTRECLVNIKLGLTNTGRS